MSPNSLLPSRPNLTATWKYAIVGGLVTVPLTLNRYWSAGVDDVISLNAVVLGGIVAGYLAKRSADADARRAGVRAGLVGGLPALWLLGGGFLSAAAAAEPTWFLAVAALFGVAIALFVLGLASLSGLLGAKVGGWLAEKRNGGRSVPPSAH